MEEACQGKLRVSEPALLSLLGNPKFEKTGVSNEEMEFERIKSVLDSLGGNLDRASSELGITKSSIKRRLTPPVQPVYEKISPSLSVRQYLEKHSGKWNILGLNPSTSEACVRMSRTNVTISVKIPPQRISPEI